MAIRQNFPPLTPDDFIFSNRLADFGPPLPFERVCDVYSVEKMSLFIREEGNELEAIPLRAPYKHQARMGGSLYRLTDEDIMELDKSRDVGLLFDRKRLPVLVPYLDHRGDMAQISAYVYVGVRSYWEERIDYGLSVNRAGVRVQGKQPFGLAQTIPHSTTLLNNRFSFVDYGQPAQRIVHLTPEMIKHCDEKNTSEIKRLHLRLVQEEKDRKKALIHLAKAERWARIKQKVKAFVE